MQPSSYFCPHVFYLHSTEEPNNLNFEKSELRNVRCKQQASVLTNRGFVWEICCVTGFSSLSVYVLTHICWDNRTTGQDRRACYFTTDCNGRARNEFVEIIFRISGSKPYHKWTAQPALCCCASLRSAPKINGAETLPPILLNLVPL